MPKKNDYFIFAVDQNFGVKYVVAANLLHAIKDNITQQNRAIVPVFIFSQTDETPISNLIHGTAEHGPHSVQQMPKPEFSTFYDISRHFLTTSVFELPGGSVALVDDES